MALKVPVPKLRLKKKRVEEIKFSAECKLPYHEEEEPWYLKEYIAQVRENYGEPDFVDKVPSEYKFKKQFNVIYPVGGGIFIHALSERTEGGYARYIVIEPPRPPEEILRKAEELIAAKIPEGYIPKSPQEKACMLLELVKSSFTSLGGPNGGKRRLAFRKRGSNSGNGGKETIKYVKPEELLNAVTYHIVRDKISVGLLEPFIRDPYIEDISCSGLGNIFIIHKIFGPMESNIGFKSHDELNAYLIALAEKIGKPLSNARPIVDATLPDGSRINIVYGTDVSLRGSNFTIRKVSKTPLSVTQLINWGTFDARVAAYMWILLREGMSGFICGETASGKTTSLTAMLVFIRPSAKIVSIEDTAEVIVPHPNWTRELTRDTGKPESSVTMFDLLKAALRQRPNYIIVGEIRGAEGNIAFQAMQSVSWDTPILVRNDETGRVEFVNIGEFVDKYYEEGEERTPKHVDKYSVLSMDKNGRVKWSKMRYVLRHRASEIYEITYEGKGVLKATGSHSVFVLDEDTLEVSPKPVSRLKKGDLLVSFVKRHTDERKLEIIDVYDLLRKHNHRVRLVNNNVKVGSSKPLKRQLVLDKEIAFLLGTYLADGCIEYKNELNPVVAISMGASEKTLMEKTISIVKKLSANISIRDRQTYNIVKVHNAPLAYTVASLVGRKLTEKRVPSELWSSPPNVIRGFFEGYVADARRTNVRGGIVVYTTKNRRLAVELVWLARLAGLESKMFEIKDKRYGRYYDIHVRLFPRQNIRNWSDRIPLKPLIKIIERNNLEKKLPLALTYVIRRYRYGKQRFVLRKTAKKVIEFIEKYEKSLDEESRRLLERAKRILESDIALLKVIDVKKKKYNGYVYDISVPGTELFIGGEIPIALHNTGHPVLSTFHAADIDRLVQRLTNHPINVPKTNMDSLNFAWFQSAVYTKQGFLARRMIKLYELIGYDPSTDSILAVPVFVWDPSTDRFIFSGRGASYLLEEKIAVMKGIPRSRIKEIYDELELRRAFLEEMVRRKIFNYWDVWKAVVKADELGVEEALRRLRAGTLL